MVCQNMMKERVTDKGWIVDDIYPQSAKLIAPTSVEIRDRRPFFGRLITSL
jgi:hypothetical protein